MITSILTSTKKLLGIEADQTVFDTDIIFSINAAFSTLSQLGVGPVNGFAIEDDSTTWDTYLGTNLDLSAVKIYVYLRVRLIFDPPTTSYLIESLKEQAKELEWRLNTVREGVSWTPPLT